MIRQHRQQHGTERAAFGGSIRAGERQRPSGLLQVVENGNGSGRKTRWSRGGAVCEMGAPGGASRFGRNSRSSNRRVKARADFSPNVMSVPMSAHAPPCVPTESAQHHNIG
jgi:hypothetical protein